MKRGRKYDEISNAIILPPIIFIITIHFYVTTSLLCRTEMANLSPSGHKVTSQRHFG